MNILKTLCKEAGQVENTNTESIRHVASSPFPVLKHSKTTTFSITIDLRPVNAATKAKTWPMSSLELELTDLAENACFATLDFCIAYQQLLLQQMFQKTCSIILREGVRVPMQVLHGLKNPVATSWQAY